MLKRLLIVTLCFSIGILFSTTLFSQDDPSATEDEMVEDTADESKEEVSGEFTEKTGGETAITVQAKTYSDGITTFINSKVKFQLTASDNIAVEKIEYKIDEGTTATYESPFSIDSEGNHIIKYYGIDKSGNKETEKAYSVIVDNTPPVVVVTTNMPVKKIGDKIYYSKDLLFSINASDALSGVNKVDYSVNGVDYQEYTSPFKISNMGEVNFKVKAVDNVTNATEQFVFSVFDEAGNEVELKDGVVKLTTDSVLPTVEIKPDKELKQINDKNVASTDVKYTVIAKDDESGVASTMVRVDGKGDFIPYKSEIQFLTNGKHQIEAKAIDKAGNESTIIIFKVYVDMIPPKSEIGTVE